MSSMQRFAFTLTTSFVLASCVPPLPSDPLVDQLQGVWSGCRGDAAGDLREQILVDGNSLTWTVRRHETADGSCGGPASTETAILATYVVGDPLYATLPPGGAQVIAKGLDVTDATRSFYTTAYVDGAATPRALYLGDPDASPTYDMTSGDKRPLVLRPDPLLAQ